MTLRSFICCLPALLVAGAVLARDAKPPRNEKKDETVVWKERAVPGPAVTLRIKRTEGKGLIYEGSLERSQQGPSSYIETSSFYLNVFCMGSSEGLDQLALWRTYLSRTRNEKLENGKKINRVLPNSTEPINLGPNYSVVGSVRCYAFNTQNQLAYRTEQITTLKDGKQIAGKTLTETENTVTFLTETDKIEVPRAEIVSTKALPVPHVCLNETPHYFFPILSSRQVSPGDTWRFKVPVIIPLEQATSQVLPTSFNVAVTGRLREVRQEGKTQVAVVDYQVDGTFDSSSEEYQVRFPADFLEGNRVLHAMSGEGELTLDVEKGRVLSKTESFTILLFAHATTPQGADKEPKVEENKAEITSHYEIRLLPPGTQLKNGGVVPDYE